jgi:hypothetical protein
LLDEHGQKHIPPPQAAKLQGFKIPNMVPKAYIPSCGSSNASWYAVYIYFTLGFLLVSHLMLVDSEEAFDDRR